MPHKGRPADEFREARPPEQGDGGIAALARAQAGQVSSRQLRAAGLSADAIAGRARDGLLHRAGRGVYEVGYRRNDDPARAWRAVLRYPDTALGFRSSAWGHGLRLALGGPVHLSSMTNRRDRPGVRVHEVKCLEIVLRKGLPCTPLPRTLLDCATQCDTQELARLINRAEELRILDLRPILPLLEGHRGSPALREALALQRLQAGGTQSELERRFKALIATSGLPEPDHGRKVGPFWVDAIYERERIAIELDGRTHLALTSRQRDGRRDAWLQRRGWRVVRLTWLDVVEDASYVLDTLAHMLATRT